MAANTPSVARTTAQTQAGNGTVDTVTFTSNGDSLYIDNRSATVNIWLTYSSPGGTAPATPSAGLDGALYCPAGAFRAWPICVGTVKLFGDAANMTYVLTSL